MSMRIVEILLTLLRTDSEAGFEILQYLNQHLFKS
jgi:hypothetical protein